MARPCNPRSMLTAEHIIETLHRVPLTCEGGYFVHTYRSQDSTAIYYLHGPQTVSLLHRLTVDEVYHFYLGDPIELLEIAPDGTRRRVVLGQDLLAGQVVQHVIRAGTWQGTRLI